MQQQCLHECGQRRGLDGRQSSIHSPALTAVGRLGNSACCTEVVCHWLCHSPAVGRLGNSACCEKVVCHCCVPLLVGDPEGCGAAARGSVHGDPRRPQQHNHHLIPSHVGSDIQRCCASAVGCVGINPWCCEQDLDCRGVPRSCRAVQCRVTTQRVVRVHVARPRPRESPAYLQVVAPRRCQQVFCEGHGD